MHGVHGVIDSPLLGIKLEGFSLSLSLSLARALSFYVTR